MDALLAFLGAATIFTLMLQLLGVVFSYEFGERVISYRAFGLVTVGRIAYDSIEDVRVLKAWPIPHGDSILHDHTMVFASRWPSKVFVRSCVYIRTRSHFAKVFILSPKDAGKFVDQVNEHIAKSFVALATTAAEAVVVQSPATPPSLSSG